MFIRALDILRTKYHHSKRSINNTRTRTHIWDYGFLFSQASYSRLILWRTKIQMRKLMTLHRSHPSRARTRMWNKLFDIDMRNAGSFCSDFCFYGKMARHDTPAPCTRRTQTNKQRTRNNKYLLRLNQKKYEMKWNRRTGRRIGIEKWKQRVHHVCSWIYSILFNVHAAIAWCDIYYLILSIFHVLPRPLSIGSHLFDDMYATFCIHRSYYAKHYILHNMGRQSYECSVFVRKYVFDASKAFGFSAKHRIRIDTRACVVDCFKNVHHLLKTNFWFREMKWGFKCT